MDVVAAVWQTATPLVLAALAGVLSQRAGIWHLGLGGLISIGAWTSVVVTRDTGSIAIGVLAAIVASMLMSVVMWAAIIGLRANPIIVGIGINAIGTGGTILGTVAVDGAEGKMISPERLPRPLEFLGSTGFGSLSIVALATPILVLLVWLLVSRTRYGLRVTAIGDYPFAARSAGVPSGRTRLIVLVLGGVLCGLSGAELALGALGSFTPGMEAGRGLIAFAAVILGASHPLASAGAALFFGAVDYFGIWAQITWQGVVPTEFMLMLPYFVTIVAVVITARIRGGSTTMSLGEIKS
jgi:ABC-type uncharacterized transport system permease subunit